MAQLFLIVGSSIFLFLGTVHLVLTFRDLSHPRYFTPPDKDLRAAMQRSSVALNPKINLWLAWLGFNFSHSLGILIFGGAFLYIGILYPTLFSRSVLLQILSILVAAAYLTLSLKFWFSKPAIGTGISTACFILAVVASYI